METYRCLRACWHSVFCIYNKTRRRCLRVSIFRRSFLRTRIRRSSLDLLPRTFSRSTRASVARFHLTKHTTNGTEMERSQTHATIAYTRVCTGQTIAFYGLVPNRFPETSNLRRFKSVLISKSSLATGVHNKTREKKNSVWPEMSRNR